MLACFTACPLPGTRAYKSIAKHYRLQVFEGRFDYAVSTGFRFLGNFSIPLSCLGHHSSLRTALGYFLESLPALLLAQLNLSRMRQVPPESHSRDGFYWSVVSFYLRKTSNQRFSVQSCQAELCARSPSDTSPPPSYI